MSEIKDCGDMRFQVVIRTGIKFMAVAVEDDDKLARIRIDEKIADILPQLEKTIMDQICDHIGYDAETVEAMVKERDDKLAADREAEEKGRAEKKARRDNLPPLQPPPPAVVGLGAPAPQPEPAPTEGASEQEDNPTD